MPYRCRRSRVIFSVLPGLRRQLWEEPVGKLTALAKADTFLLAKSVSEFKSSPAKGLSAVVLAVPSQQPDERAFSGQGFSDDAPHQV